MIIILFIYFYTHSIFLQLPGFFFTSVTPLARKKLTSVLISAPVQSCLCYSGVTDPFALSCWSNELRSATAACSHSAADRGVHVCGSRLE